MQPRLSVHSPTAEKSDSQTRTVREVITFYVKQDGALGTHAESRLERLRILSLFVDAYGAYCVEALRPFVLTNFLKAQPTLRANETRKRWASTISCAFNTATKYGWIERNPFAGMSFPGGKPGRDMTDAEFGKLLKISRPNFRRVLLFLRYTGARPGEMRSITLDDIDLAGRVISLASHKTAIKTGKPRRILLSETAAKLTRWLMKRARGGLLFTNSYGRPWSKCALCKHLRDLRMKAGLPVDLKLYSARHAFGTGAIVNGLPTATVAELMGHSGLDSVSRYVHLSNKGEHLRAAIEQALK